jgi:general secretion pathway protein C
MLSRLSAFVIWALVAGTVVFWGLRLAVRAPAAPAYAVAVGDPGAVRADLSRVLGNTPTVTAAAAPPAEASSRFKLIGIMAPKGGVTPPEQHNPGVALIAVDGKPPRAFGVGARLDGDLVLQSVSLRTASIGPAQGAPYVQLELPPLPAAATGTLPMMSTGGPIAPASPAMPVPQRPVSLPQAVPPAGLNVAPRAPTIAPPPARPEGALPTK